MNASLPLSAPARFALIMDGLMKAVAAKFADYPWTGAMVLYVWTRLTRINQKFQALAALILAGKTPPERPFRPRPARILVPMPAAPDPVAPDQPYPVWRLFSQERFAWLCRAMPNLFGRFGAAPFGSGLRELLADPEMAALLAVSPRIRKLLRPLLWMLGIEASLPRPPPPPSPVPGAAPAGAEKASPDAVFATAPSAHPPVPPGDETPAGVPDDPAPSPEFFARA